jgi:hypothetical protein
VYQVFAGLVCEPQLELGVDAGLGYGIGVLDDFSDVAECLDDVLDCRFGERREWPGNALVSRRSQQ